MADPAVIALAFDRRMASVRSQVVAYLSRAWGTLDNWRDADIERFVNLIAPVVEGGQAQIATLTDAYLAAYFTAVTGARVAPVGIAAKTVTTESLRGVTTVEAYTRAGVTTRLAISEGASFVEAAQRGLDRAVKIAETDIQLAKTHTATRIMSDNPHVVGYRRVLHGTHSCGLCLVASTQRYSKSRLMPIHPGCDCGIAPIVGTHDPGQIIDPDTLSATKTALAERFGGVSDSMTSVGLRDVLVTHEHGEIGPILAVRGQHFDTA